MYRQEGPSHCLAAKKNPSFHEPFRLVSRRVCHRWPLDRGGRHYSPRRVGPRRPEALSSTCLMLSLKEDRSELLKLARVWDRHGLLGLTRGPLPERQLTRVFGAYKGPRQAASDRRPPEGQLSRGSGPWALALAPHRPLAPSGFPTLRALSPMLSSLQLRRRRRGAPGLRVTFWLCLVAPCFARPTLLCTPPSRHSFREMPAE